MERYPKGATELRLATIFKVTTPFYSEGVETLPWLWFEYEDHKSTILSAYDDGRHPHAMSVLEKLMEVEESGGSDSASGVSAQGRHARDVATSPTGATVAPRKNRWLFTQHWVAPSVFALVRDPEVRQLLKDYFPDGLNITSVEHEIIDLEHESLADVWATCFPEPGESMYPDPIVKDYMGGQDLINDVHNILVETMERANPITLYDPNVIDRQHLQRNANQPAEFVAAVPGVGKRLQDSMWTTPKSEMNSQIMGWSDSIIEKFREICGILPALFGGEGPSQTAYEASRKLNQALMQLSPVWNEMRDFWKAVYTNAVRQTIKYDPDWADLDMEGWHVEVEEAIPMTWGQIRDFFVMLLERGPEAWQLFGLVHPNNLSTVHTALGLTGWTLPNLKERDAILTTVRQLLQGVPIPTEIGLMPSIPPDDFEFAPPLVVDVVREWIAGEGQQVKESNPEGYANVLAWGKAYAQMMMPPPGAPPPDGAPPKGPSGPPKPPEMGPGVPEGEPLPQGVQGMLPPGPAPPPSVTAPQSQG
jgi:hypothetical protein